MNHIVIGSLSVGGLWAAARAYITTVSAALAADRHADWPADASFRDRWQARIAYIDSTTSRARAYRVIKQILVQSLIVGTVTLVLLSAAHTAI